MSPIAERIGMPGVLIGQIGPAGQEGFVQRIVESLRGTVVQMWDQALQFIPNVAAMLVILLVGYIVARVLRWITRTVLNRLQFDSVCDRIGLHEVTQSFGMKATATKLASQLSFWAIMLMFLVAAVDALGMESVTQSINTVLAYIPNVLGALVIVVFGLMLGNFVRALIHGTAERLGIEYGGAVGQLVYGLIVVLVGSLAVGQLNLNTALVDRAIEIALMAVGAALALALGFGTRDMAKHVVAGVYARDSFPVGSKFAIDGKSGTVAAVRAVNTAIETSQGTIVIPNARLMEMEVLQED